MNSPGGIVVQVRMMAFRFLWGRDQRMSLSPQRRLLQIVLAVLVQISLLPGAVGLGCVSQRLVGADCCCTGIADPVADEAQTSAENSCCGEAEIAPRSSLQQHDAIEYVIAAEPGSSCGCEASPSDPLPAPLQATDDSGPRAQAVPAQSGDEIACGEGREFRGFARGAGRARFGPPIYLLNQIFLI